MDFVIYKSNNSEESKITDLNLTVWMAQILTLEFVFLFFLSFFFSLL